MARPPRDPRLRLDQPGQRPLLQGHLRRGGRPAAAEPPEPIAPAPAEDAGGTPAEEAGAGQAGAARGKATRTPGTAGTRRNLEGSEQGPV